MQAVFIYLIDYNVDIAFDSASELRLMRTYVLLLNRIICVEKPLAIKSLKRF